MTLPRGFKAEAERAAIAVRSELGLKKDSVLDVTAMADLRSVRIVDAADLVDRSRLEDLERLQSFAFSAATFEVGSGRVIVTNPLREPGRQASDIAHELSHLELSHQLGEVRQLDGLAFRTCDPAQEEQATAYGATLLLPRPLLVTAASRGLGIEEIAAESGVTVQMARFRYNTTGIARQFARRP